MAQLLWAKTHAVLHAGIEERPALPGEAESRAGEFHGHGAGGGVAGEAESHDHEHHEGGAHEDHEEGHVLVIRPASEDFRGVLGDLERTLKPYLAPSGRMYEKAADQTMPFYRLMTWADPHFVQGWTVGAVFIADGGKAADEGLRYLHEGERLNPGSWEIQVELGHFYLVYKRDHAAAERHLTRAFRLLPPNARLGESEQEALVEAHRWLALCYVEAGRPVDAVRVATAGRRLAPGDVTFGHVLRFQGRNWTSRDLQR